MAYTTPGTAVAGDVLTASFWNQQVRDNMDFVAGAPFARNILYNGAMQVAQRNTSVASITTGNYYTADRWTIGISSLGTWTQSVENDAPTGSGLRKSLKMLCTTADAAPAAGDYLAVQQLIEGYDVQRIAKGTSSAQQLTLTFWVKSNVTGTYIAELVDNDNSRGVSKSYTVSASGTWEKKEIVFPADTTGAFDNDNAASLTLNLWLGAGTTFTSGTLATTWASLITANRVVGQTNLASATNNYWQVTGVQLEVGSAATGFEFLPYGDELRRCQRYYESSFAPDVVPGTNSLAVVETGGYALNSANGGGAFVPYATQKRTHTHTVSVWAPLNNPSANRARRAYDGTTHSVSVVVSTVAGFAITITSGSADMYQIGWTASAEL